MKKNKMIKSILIVFMLVILCAPMVVKAAVYQGGKLDSSISLPKYELQEEKKGKIEVYAMGYDEDIMPQIKYNILNSNRDIVDTLIINSNGYASSNNLPLGKYYAQEIITLEEDFLVQEVEVEINEDNSKVSIMLHLGEVFVKKGKIKISVEDRNREPVENAKYDVLNDKKEKIDTLVTNENGIAEIKEVPYGKYYIKESGKTEGYLDDENMYEVLIDSSEEIVLVIIKERKMPILRVDPRITFVDQKGKPISSASITIEDEKNNCIVRFLTDEEGVCSFPHELFEYGKEYYVTIEKESNDYLYNTIKTNFKYDKIIDITIKNYTSDFVFIKGDLDENGIVNANDAAIALDLYKYGNVTEHELNVGDMDNNGIINANDAALILDVYKYGN